MINREARMNALEMVDELAEAVQASGKKGLSFVDGAELFGMDYRMFYGAVLELAALNRIKVAMGLGGHRNVIVMPDWDAPAKCCITDRQRAVLDLMCGRADENGIVRISRKQIRDALGCSDATFILDRLDSKGFLDFIELGGPTRAALFKMYPEGDGPKNCSWWARHHGRPPIHLLAQWTAGTTEPPEKPVAEEHSRVLELLVASADSEGFVALPRSKIKEAAGVTRVTFILDALDHKGFIEFQGLTSTGVAQFKLFPKGNGPRRYSWRGFGHNRMLRD